MKALLLHSVLSVFSAGILAAAEVRQALVMGVWDYSDPKFPALPGIEADVSKMTAKLKELGFTVSVVTNPTLSQAKDAVDDFGAKLKTGGDAGVGLFYFSGHGSEHDGKNYLVPKGTRVSTRGDLDDEALSAQRILTRMEEAGNNVNLVFLDCCRNALSKTGGDDLAPMRASGTFIGFATASAKAAGAGDEGSPYTTALLENLGLPGVSITDVHTKVTRRVKELTEGDQTPFQYSGLDDVFYLLPKVATAEPVVARVPSGMSEAEFQKRLAEELAKRTSMPPISNSGSPISNPPSAISNLPSPASGSKGFTNTLGMKFVPVPGTQVLFCVHETRNADYAAYARSASGVDSEWKSEASGKEEHPVVNVSWEDANAFCEWLSKKEGKTYRLPTDHEWSVAVGIGSSESASASPADKNGKIADVFPWGGDYPPEARDGNYDITGVNDGHSDTAPVMQFKANALGLYDLGGNVVEWCQDLYSPSSSSRVLRGGSWGNFGGVHLASSYRLCFAPIYHGFRVGFRCVVVAGSSSR